MSDIMEHARQYVKRRLLTGLEPSQGRYRYAHTLRVADIGRGIARAEGLDEEMLVLGCLLHDVGYVLCQTDEDYADHGRLSADIAAEFLRDAGCDPEKADSICYGVRIHTLEEAKFPRPATALELSVGDADNIDRFDAYRLYEGLCWLKPESLTCAELKAQAARKAEGHDRLRSIPFATPTATRLWQEKLNFCVDYYTWLEAQMAATLAWDEEPERLTQAAIL